MLRIARIISVALFVTMISASNLLLGQVIKENRKVGSFVSIEVGGAFHVVLIQGDKYSVVVEADEDIIERIETEVRGDELRITQLGKINDPGVLKVYVEFKDLERLDISGAAEVESRELIKGRDLEVLVSGAGNVNLSYQGGSFEADISGAGNLNVEGKVNDQRVKISGAGNYHAYDLQCQNLEIKTTGAGNARVSASKKIKAYARGAGNISYRGDPEQVYADASGAGNIFRNP